MFELRGLYNTHNIAFCLSHEKCLVYQLLHEMRVCVYVKITEKTYKETTELIAKSYTSLFEDFLCNMLNQTSDVITELCNNLGWEIQEGDYPRLILPRRPPEVKVNTDSAENLLAKLTDFVSFLEN